MKRNMATAIMILLLCVLLCACGYRDRNTGTTANDAARDPMKDRTDMAPDTEDGIIDENSDDNGVITDGRETGEKADDESVLDESFLSPRPSPSPDPGPKTSMKP